MTKKGRLGEACAVCGGKPASSPSKRQRTIPIRGSRWKIRWVPNLGDKAGECSYHEKILRVALGQPREAEIDTVIHEILHAALPDLEEEAVHATANAIAGALVKLKYV